MQFPDGFVWGASTSAYQIEGGHDADGKGPSVWDAISRKPGAVLNTDRGDVACDHYHRWREDVALMKDMGLKAYRFSISWSRVLPEGTGRVNEAGLGFYERLVDALVEAGITPFVTMYHWDIPLELHRRGGWMNRESAAWFEAYAALIVRRLGPRVTRWITINEPQCFWNMGYSDQLRGVANAGLAHAEALEVTHNVLRAHGRGAAAARGLSAPGTLIGWAPVGVTYHPATDAPADVEATRTRMMTVRANDMWSNTWYNDPVVFGHYPEDGLRANHAVMPRVMPGDMEEIRQPIDFLGLNIYQSNPIKAGPNGQPEEVPHAPGVARTRFGWPITPQCLYWGPRFIAERYRLPVYMTENGYSGADAISLDARCHDPQRIDFYARYLRELRRCIADGTDIRGYFAWSLLDNFEWREGYEQRFGLVHIDYATGARTPKDSAYFYSRVTRTNGAAALEGTPRELTTPPTGWWKG
jgi:beta-glucosidase